LAAARLRGPICGAGLALTLGQGGYLAGKRIGRLVAPVVAEATAIGLALKKNFGRLPAPWAKRHLRDSQPPQN